MGDSEGDQEASAVVGASEGVAVIRVGYFVGLLVGADEDVGAVGAVGRGVGPPVTLVGDVDGDHVCLLRVGPIVGFDVQNVGVQVGETVVGAPDGVGGGYVGGTVGAEVGLHVSRDRVGPTVGPEVRWVGL